MKLFKKFLLVAGAVGLVSSFGFANKAMAAGEVTITVNPDSDSAEVETTVSGNLVVYAKGASSGSETLQSTISLSENKTVKTPISGIKGKVNSKKSSFSGTVSVEADLTMNSTGATVTETAVDKLYRVKISAGSGGTITGGNIDEYAYAGETITVKASPNSGYDFNGWSDGNMNLTRTLTVSKNESANNLTASFVSSGPVYEGPSYMTATVTSADGKTTRTYNTDDDYEIEMAVNQKISFSITKPSGATKTGIRPDSGYKSYFDTSSGIKATKENSDGIYFTSVAYYGSSDTEGEEGVYFLVYIKGTDNSAVTTPRINTTDYVEYITNGYTLEFKATPVDKSIPLRYINFAAKNDSSYKDYVDSVNYTENTSDGNVTVKVKFKDKVDKGTNDKAIKLVATAYVGGAWRECTIDSDTAKEKDVTIYSTPTLSYSDDNRTLTYKAPKKVNTSSESGVDDSNKDSTKTAISDVKGIKLQVLKDSDSLGTTSVAKEKGTGATIDAATVESIINNLNSKFSADSTTITFRAFPCDSSANYNKKVYADASANVYKVVITYTKADGTTGEEVFYGLKGQEIDITSRANLKNATIKDSDKKTKVTVSDSTSNNRYTAVLGARESDSEGLDRVPKTGQNNAIIFVMVAIVAAAVCAGLYFYNKKAKNI